MIGLVCKDMLCLKKNLTLFFGVTIGVIIIALLYILSSKYGNIAIEFEEMAEMEGEDFAMLQGTTKAVVYFSLLVPIAFLATIVECFKEDFKAGFYKNLMSLPLSEAKIVGSRYVSCMLFTVVAMLGSVLTAFLVSLVEKDMPFENSFKYIVIFTTVLMVYISLVMFLLYLFGARKADLIQSVPFVILLIVAEGWFAMKLQTAPEGEEMHIFSELGSGVKTLVNDYGYLLFLGALCCMGISFLGSWLMMKRRRGNI